jgi:predicted RNA-binding protein associated with RNAse of E/G family
VPGSFDELAAAYRRGELTRAQYRTLAEAVAESLRAEDEREA